MTDYSEIGFEIHLTDPFDLAIERLTSALKDEGFGILTRIDVHKTLKEKLNEDFRQYAILGACNPPLAFKALTTDPTSGLLLPCNVTVESTPTGGSLIRIANPQAMLSVGKFHHPDLHEAAQQATQRLLRVAEELKNL